MTFLGQRECCEQEGFTPCGRVRGHGVGVKDDVCIGFQMPHKEGRRVIKLLLLSFMPFWQMNTCN